GLSFKNFPATLGTFAHRLLSGEINFRRSNPGLSFSFRLRLAFLNFKAEIFFVGQHEKGIERPALARDETLEQVRSSRREQFLHLFALNRSLQNDLARSIIAAFCRTDCIFTDVAHSKFDYAPTAF